MSRAFHGYTPHGHACCEKTTDHPPTLVARCGGPNLCHECDESAVAKHNGTQLSSPQLVERSLVDEIQSTRDGRAALRFASENCDLRELLDIAHRIISEGQHASLTDIQAFAKGYTLDLEKRK